MKIKCLGDQTPIFILLDRQVPKARRKCDEYYTVCMLVAAD